MKHFVARLMLVALLGFVPLAAGGCGFVITNGPPQGHEQLTDFECTESNLGPTLDIAWAAFQPVSAMSVLGEDVDWSGFGKTEENAGTAFGVAITWAALSTASGIVGLKKTSRCREAKRRLAQRQLLERD
jgi:hypothetical protein